MLTSRRDYILRLIDEVGRLLTQAIFKQKAGAGEAALQTIVMACERLFGLEGDKLFQFTPAQHFLMLTEGETPAAARDKVLLYAALNREAGILYDQVGNRQLTQATRLNALRFTLRARTEFPDHSLPEFAPQVSTLLAELDDTPLDEETTTLLLKFRANTRTAPPRDHPDSEG